MFIKNFSSICKDNIIQVNEATKDYLMSCGFIPVSLNNDMWVFRKSADLLNILNSIQNGGENIGR